MRQAFKEFAAKGNVADVAAGVALAAAFGVLVNAVVRGLLLPPLGLLLGGADVVDLFTVLRPGTPAGPYPTLAAAQAAGAVVLSWGSALSAAITFCAVVLALYPAVRRVNRLKQAHRMEVAAQAAPPGLTAEEQLLAEIRDLLRAQEAPKNGAEVGAQPMRSNPV